MGFEGRKRERGKEAVQCVCVMCEVQSNHNITPLSRSMSVVMSLVLIHEDPHLGSVDHFDVLEDPHPRHVLSTSS